MAGHYLVCFSTGPGKHSPEDLAALGLLTFCSGSSSGSTEADTVKLLNQQTLVQVGQGLPALPKKLVERIRSNEYVDFMELPPAKGKSRPPSHAMEGQILVVQATDLAQGRKVVPDLATWMQCFAIYTAVLGQEQPARLPELMAYQSTIAKASQKYKWPSWVIYDQSFRQEMAGTTGQSWAKVDPSIYSLCFTGQAISSENWCAHCQSLDHTIQSCPARPRRRPWSTAPVGPPQQGARNEICQKFNRFNGDCKFGRGCRFKHICSSCGEPHPVSKCKPPAERPPAEKRPRQAE